MLNDELVKFLINDVKEIKSDVKSLMKFRWMVMGGAIVASFVFTVLFEIAKAMAEGR